MEKKPIRQHYAEYDNGPVERAVSFLSECLRTRSAGCGPDADEVARLLGVDRAAVLYAARRLGIPVYSSKSRGFTKLGIAQQSPSLKRLRTAAMAQKIRNEKPGHPVERRAQHGHRRRFQSINTGVRDGAWD